MSDADAQVQPFVEFELSCFVPPRRAPDPTPRLPGEPRVKGRVVFHYLYHKRRMRKTELTVGFTCPFCNCVNRDFAGLSQHLEACHDAFNFEFLPKVQNEPDPRVHVVCKSELEEEEEEKAGARADKDSQRRQESDWFHRQGGWFVQSKAKVQMTHHELNNRGGVIRKEVSPASADREFVYASGRYRMPSWLRRQRSTHRQTALDIAKAAREEEKQRRKAQRNTQKHATYQQRLLMPDTLQRAQLEQIQRQQQSGGYRLAGDLGGILNPQVHPGLLNHIMLNQAGGGQLGVHHGLHNLQGLQGLGLGGQIGGLGGGWIRPEPRADST